MRVALAGALAVLALLAATGPAAARPKHPKHPTPVATPAPAPASPTAYAGPVTVEAAEQAYATLNYDVANQITSKLTLQHGLTHDVLVRVYRLHAISLAILGREEQARDAFVLLLTYSPDYQADQNLGPKVETPFLEARGFWRAQPAKPGIELSVELHHDGPGVLHVTTHDPTHVVKEVHAAYRWAGAGDFVVGSVATGDAIAVDVPAPPPGATRLEYWANATDDRDDVVFETGNAQAPKVAVVEIPPEAPPPKKPASLLASPFFWLVAGAVVVGGATAVYFVARPGPATSTTLTPTLHCGDPTDPSAVCK